ncbi:MAG: sensor histidine kinase [Sulfuricella sp.]
MNRELESFSYSVSHDLRTPLRSIDGFSQALAEDYGEGLDAVGHDYLNRVRRAAQRMGVLIDDLLRLARVTRADMSRTRIDLSALAESVMADLRKHKGYSAATLTVQPGLAAYGDPALLRIMLENLLDNACKYSSKVPQPKIEFGSLAQVDRTVFFVRDNGAGFDMTYVDKLFGAFQRLHREDEFSGTGVGLATVKRIVHRHGGEVWAEGLPDEGAVFYFTLGGSGVFEKEPLHQAAG